MSMSSSVGRMCSANMEQCRDSKAVRKKEENDMNVGKENSALHVVVMESMCACLGLCVSEFRQVYRADGLNLLQDDLDSSGKSNCAY